MPIKGITDKQMLPRLGKVRLGLKIEGKEGKKPHPKATDYFVCPEEVQAVVGEEPKQLTIMFPVEDETKIASQWLKCYSSSQGLVCKGDGESANRMIDVATGAMANRDTKEAVRKDVKCPYAECPEYQKGQCKEVMSLHFLMPDVPGLGIWQLDTGSYYSIRNTNDCLSLIRNVVGRISMIPLTLTLVPIEVKPEGGRKKKVHIIQITTNATLRQLVESSHKEFGGLIEAPLEDKPPDNILPENIINGESRVIEPDKDLTADKQEFTDKDEAEREPFPDKVSEEPPTENNQQEDEASGEEPLVVELADVGEQANPASSEETEAIPEYGVNEDDRHREFIKSCHARGWSVEADGIRIGHWINEKFPGHGQRTWIQLKPDEQNRAIHLMLQESEGKEER